MTPAKTRRPLDLGFIAREIRAAFWEHESRRLIEGAIATSEQLVIDRRCSPVAIVIDAVIEKKKKHTEVPRTVGIKAFCR